MQHLSQLDYQVGCQKTKGTHIKHIQKMKQSDCIRSWPICKVSWLYADNSLTCALGQAYCTIFAINGGPESFRKLCPQDRQTKLFALQTEQLTFFIWGCGLPISWLRFMAQASVALDTCIKDFTALSKVGVCGHQRSDQEMDRY